MNESCLGLANSVCNDVFHTCLLMAAALVACLDCEKMVSRRALMCPNCGCRGEKTKEINNRIYELYEANKVLKKTSRLFGSKIDANRRAMSAGQDYFAGTAPTDMNDFLRAMISMKGGMPDVTWTPNLNTNGEVRVYKVWGKADLMDSAWTYPTNSTHRFFKVTVEMP